MANEKIKFSKDSKEKDMSMVNALADSIKTIGVGRKRKKDLSPDLIKKLQEGMDFHHAPPISIGALFGALFFKGFSQLERNLLASSWVKETIGERSFVSMMMDLGVLDTTPPSTKIEPDAKSLGASDKFQKNGEENANSEVIEATRYFHALPSMGDGIDAHFGFHFANLLRGRVQTDSEKRIDSRTGDRRTPADKIAKDKNEWTEQENTNQAIQTNENKAIQSLAKHKKSSSRSTENEPSSDKINPSSNQQSNVRKLISSPNNSARQSV